MKPSPEQVREWAEKAGAKFDPHWGIAYNTGTATFERFAELVAQWGASQAQQTTDPLGFQIRRAIAAEDELRATKQTLEHAYAALQKVADKAQQTTEETDAEMALRSIASWLGVGGFNAPTVDAKVFEQKIYEGVEMAIKSHYATAEEPELPEAAETLQIPDTALGRDYDSITKVIFHLSMAKREPGWLVGACWLASSILARIKALGPLYTTAQMHGHYQAGVRSGMAQSQWQPIETAPKDGRSFDVWVKSTKNPDYGVRMTDVYYVQGVLCGSKLPNSSWCEYASHWTPRPTPPAMQGGQQP